jgi:hypothetical protein
VFFLGDLFKKHNGTTNFILVTQFIKKLDPRLLDSPGYSGLRRRSSHSGTAALWDELTTYMCFGCGADERVFFSWPLRPKPQIKSESLRTRTLTTLVGGTEPALTTRSCRSRHSIYKFCFLKVSWKWWCKHICFSILSARMPHHKWAWATSPWHEVRR